jgi:thiol:disulfide interchange protein
MVGFVPALRRRLPKPGPWMARLQRFLAIPMAATAAACVWLLYRQGGNDALLASLAATAVLAALLAWLGWRQRSGSAIGWVAVPALIAVAGAAIFFVPQRPENAVNIPRGAEPWSEANVARYVEQSRPVFVYFTADWCLTCKANEVTAIDRLDVHAEFKKAGVKVLAGDWTNGDPAITRFLESRGRAGVPRYLWYRPGRSQPEELLQILTASKLISRARSGP